MAKGKRLELPKATNILQENNVDEAIEGLRMRIETAANGWVLDLFKEDLDNVESDLVRVPDPFGQPSGFIE